MYYCTFFAAVRVAQDDWFDFFQDQEAHVDQTVKKFFQAFAHEKFRLPQTEMSLVFDKYAHMFSQNADVDITMTLAPKATVQILHLWGKKDKVEKILLEIK